MHIQVNIYGMSNDRNFHVKTSFTLQSVIKDVSVKCSTIFPKQNKVLCHISNGKIKISQKVTFIGIHTYVGHHLVHVFYALHSSYAEVCGVILQCVQSCFSEGG